MKLAAIVLAAGLCLPAAAQSPAPRVLLPESFDWFSPPNNPAVRGAWVIGAETAPGPYLLRVVLAAGARIPPHTHPDTRHSTVLSGTLYVAFGVHANAAELVAIPPGGVYVAPAGVLHALWAKDGEVVYQEGGVGPTATRPALP